MIYDILLDVTLVNRYVEVEADTEKEAKKHLRKEIEKAESAGHIKVWGSVLLSHKNYSYSHGAIYKIAATRKLPLSLPQKGPKQLLSAPQHFL